MDTDRYKNKVVLITGGTSGMGLATARRLLAEGASVVLTGKSAEVARSVAQQLDSGTRAVGLGLDTASIPAIEAVVEEIRRRLGSLHLVFANAGVGLSKAPEEVTPDEFDSQVAVNFRGVFFTVQKAIPIIEDGGAVVLNASWTLHRGMADSAIYSATKAAVLDLARTLASALAPRRIRVNSISPGYINTQQFNETDLGPERAAKRRAQVLLNRFGAPEEIAAAVAFLGSADASYITAQDILIDGGLVHAIPMEQYSDKPESHAK